MINGRMRSPLRHPKPPPNSTCEVRLHVPENSFPNSSCWCKLTAGLAVTFPSWLPRSFLVCQMSDISAHRTKQPAERKSRPRPSGDDSGTFFLFRWQSALLPTQHAKYCVLRKKIPISGPWETDLTYYFLLTRLHLHTALRD